MAVGIFLALISGNRLKSLVLLLNFMQDLYHYSETQRGLGLWKNAKRVITFPV
jgi:hypothetical protein